MSKRFTGWHMTAILLGAFAVVLSVNLYMASQAIGSFGGVVVENSYVASQHFNRWLDEARKENALGWSARLARTGTGQLAVETSGIPQGTSALVELRHPLGRTAPLFWQLTPEPGCWFVSAARLPEGRWIVRLTLARGAQELRLERSVG